MAFCRFCVIVGRSAANIRLPIGQTHRRRIVLKSVLCEASEFAFQQCVCKQGDCLQSDRFKVHIRRIHEQIPASRAGDHQESQSPEHRFSVFHSGGGTFYLLFHGLLCVWGFARSHSISRSTHHQRVQAVLQSTGFRRSLSASRRDQSSRY